MIDCIIEDDTCTNCEHDMHQLIESFVRDMQKLELRVVYLRYLLSGYLSEHNGNMLRYDIFTDLSSGYYDNPAYQKYMMNYCDGKDPMDCNPFNAQIWRISRGEEATDL